MDATDTHNPSEAPPGGGPSGKGPGPSPRIDVREHGAPDKDGNPQVLDRRLFMQLLVFRAATGQDAARAGQELGVALGEARVPSVVYQDLSDPRGLGLLTFSEDPGIFVRDVRPLFAREALGRVALDPAMTMMGRTYSSGYEKDLAYWILERPRETVLNESSPWAVWYPLRRSGAFARLSQKEQSSILREHSIIGRAYGARDLAHDVRLACHGLDRNDNEFVIGLLGKDLQPLSHVVETMRRTRQTSEYISQMGPFFVGHVLSRPRID